MRDLRKPAVSVPCFAAGLLWLAAPLSASQSSGATITIGRDTVIAADIVVPESTTLVIKPGVTIGFASYGKFLVRGLLVAQGMRSSPIRITCPGRPFGVKEHPCWQGLIIYGRKAHALLTWVRIEGAYATTVSEARPVLESCELVGNHHALYAIRGGAPHVRNCRIYRNVYGVVSDHAMPIMLDNLITENTVGVQLRFSAELVAGKNTIKGNETDIHSDRSFGTTGESAALQDLWNLMLETY